MRFVHTRRFDSDTVLKQNGSVNLEFFVQDHLPFGGGGGGGGGLTTPSGGKVGTLAMIRSVSILFRMYEFYH